MKMLKNILVCMLVIIVPILLITYNSSMYKNKKIQPIKPKGFFWKATKGSKEIYLVGTLHISKGNINYLNEMMKQILNKTDALALEINTKDREVLEKTESLKKDSLYLKKGELKDLLNEDEQKKFYKILKDFNIEYNEVKNLSVGGFFTYIEEVLLEQSEYTYSSDEWLREIFYVENKDIVGLESTTEHYNLIGKSTDEFKKFLNTYDSNYIKNRKDTIVQTLNAFINGDSSYMEKRVENLYEKDKISYYKFHEIRNKNMANEIDNLVKEDEKYAVAVGILHYFGKDGILKHLESKGYKITKLEN